MQHKPWIGRNYDAGINGRKVLVVGFSHWGEPHEDDADATIEAVSAWTRGEENTPFCPRIRSYFGEDDAETFWNRIAFANTLPTVVGDAAQRYADGSKEQRDAVHDRISWLIETLKPDRIFVFSRRAWPLWPEFDGDLQNGILLVQDAGTYEAGTYKHSDGEALAFGFPHPQFTPVEPTRRAVAAALRVDAAALRPMNNQF